MRLLPLALLLPLAACGQSKADPEAEAVAAQQRDEPIAGEKVACARPGVAEMATDCVMERGEGSDGTVLTIRHPDGGFRRLLVTSDGGGVEAADGAVPARVEPASADLGPGRVQVTIAGERYILPAPVKGGDAQP